MCYAIFWSNIKCSQRWTFMSENFQARQMHRTFNGVIMYYRQMLSFTTLAQSVNEQCRIHFHPILLHNPLCAWSCSESEVVSQFHIPWQLIFEATTSRNTTEYNFTPAMSFTSIARFRSSAFPRTLWDLNTVCSVRAFFSIPDMTNLITSIPKW